MNVMNTLEPCRPQCMGLEREKEVYRRHRDEWLPQYEGKFVAIKGEEIIGIFDTVEDAYEEAVRRIGKEPFLIARIGAALNE